MAQEVWPFSCISACSIGLLHVFALSAIPFEACPVPDLPVWSTILETAPLGQLLQHTPTSSLCLQLWDPQLASVPDPGALRVRKGPKGHSLREFSLPVHSTSSIQIFPSPPPNDSTKVPPPVLQPRVRQVTSTFAAVHLSSQIVPTVPLISISTRQQPSDRQAVR